MIDTSYMVWDYPDPPDETPVPLCPRCGEPLSEETYEIDLGRFVCEECFDDYIEELSREELADKIGIRHRKRD